MVAAYEAACNFADIMKREQGWDNTFFDTIASALGSARAFGLDAQHSAQALALAITPNLALGQTRLGELSMWKGCAAANAARNGLFAAMLARDGLTGPQNTISGRWGLQRVLGPFEWAPFGGRGGAFRIEHTHLKFYPAVVHAQSPVAAALKLHGRIKADDIKAITIDSYWVAKRYTDSERAASLWNPQTRETADHSLPYLLSLALTDGGIKSDSFSEARMRDPALKALMNRIRISENKSFTARFPNELVTRIEITTREGKKLEASAAYPKGHAKNPMTDADVESKFHMASEGVLPLARREDLLKLVWNLEQAPNLDTLIDLARV